jgi:hypothetical protein
MLTSGAVCAIERLINGDSDNISEVIAIAGSLEHHGGTEFDYEVTRLKTSDSKSDSDKEGLRLVLKGGKHPLDGPSKERQEQKAIIEFLCDPDKTGTEGEWESEDKYEKRADKDEDDKKDDEEDDDKTDEEDKDGESHSGMEHQLKKDNAALIWESYSDVKDSKVLRLTWHTKYACEKRDGDKDDPDDGDRASAGWGFFTWLVIM